MKNNIQKTRRTQMHLEMILSFVIFVGFVVAIFIFLNPLKQDSVNYTIYERMQERIMSNLSIDYQFIPIIMNEKISAGKDCFSVNNSLSINKNMLIKDATNKILNSSKTSDLIRVEKSLDGSNTLYILYFSDSFNNYNLAVSINCQDIKDKKNYSFGALSYEKAILYENIQNLNTQYMADYEGLKTNLGLEADFEFAVYDLNRTVLLNESLLKHKLKNTQVLSRYMLIKGINKNATPVSLYFNLRVWE